MECWGFDEGGWVACKAAVHLIDNADNISMPAPQDAVIPAKAGIQYAAASRFDY